MVHVLGCLGGQCGWLDDDGEEGDWLAGDRPFDRGANDVKIVIYSIRISRRSAAVD